MVPDWARAENRQSLWYWSEVFNNTNNSGKFRGRKWKRGEQGEALNHTSAFLAWSPFWTVWWRVRWPAYGGEGDRSEDPFSRKNRDSPVPAPTMLCPSSNSVSILFTVQSPGVRRCQDRTFWMFRHMGSGPSPRPAPSAPLLSCLTLPVPLLPGCLRDPGVNPSHL